MGLKKLLKDIFHPNLDFRELEKDEVFMRKVCGVDEIIYMAPPSDFQRRSVAHVYSNPILRWMRGKEDFLDSEVHLYEGGLRKHREELMNCSNLPKETRRYMEKYVLSNRP